MVYHVCLFFGDSHTTANNVRLTVIKEVKNLESNVSRRLYQLTKKWIEIMLILPVQYFKSDSVF